MLSTTFGAGMSMGMPDVCKTPPFAIPVPLPNIATNGVVIPGYFTIMINGLPELNITSQHAVTNGDEAGAMGGVVSNVIVGMARPMKGSTFYFVGGSPIWRLMEPTMHNLSNTPGTTMVPGQFVKIVLR